MIRLLQFLIFGHVHKWVEDERYDLFDDDRDRVGRVSYCHCSECGRPKRFAMRS